MSLEPQSIARRIAAQVARMTNGLSPEPIAAGMGDETSPEIQELLEAINALFSAYNEARDFIVHLANGNLKVAVPTRNLLVSPFKHLHASLLHLTWQTKQIAAGDFSQRVHFLGDFSAAFNTMVESLLEKKRGEASLQESQSRVKQLEGIIPICMFCKKIRQQDNCWEGLESYLASHSEAAFSHGICPECMKEHYDLEE